MNGAIDLIGCFFIFFGGFVLGFNLSKELIKIQIKKKKIKRLRNEN